jgi:hypothetical protein
MVISLKGRNMLTKNHIMLLEMLASTNWERPLYMSTTVGSDNYVGLEPFFIQEGLAYRITPFNFRAKRSVAKFRLKHQAQNIPCEKIDLVRWLKKLLLGIGKRTHGKLNGMRKKD